MNPDPESALTSLTDEQLVDRYRAGEDQAFRLLVERYQRELFHFLIRFVGDRAAAEDVFQESFLQVHNAIAGFDSSRRFKPWLFTISANKARDWLRRNRLSRQSLSAPISGNSQDDAQTSFIDLLPAPEVGPASEIETRELHEQVRTIVAEMPDHLREVLILAYFQRLPYKEIAESIQIPLGTVKSRLHAAVGIFAKLWRERTGDQPSS